MSQFATVLRENIETTQCCLRAAQEAGHSFETHLHSARLLDLLDRAASNGVDTTGWVPEAALSAASANCA
jgi:xylose isomerase